MQIEQALYGECRDGHSLLVSSGCDTVAAKIVQRLDLPDTAPPGVEWSPFLRGFPYDDRYVLARTFHDMRASRTGMVFTHALLAPLDEIAETADLGPLLGLLATSDRQRPHATTVQMVQRRLPAPHATDLIRTAEALVADGRLPAVRLGHVGFDDLVAALWAHLWPVIRRGFAFRLSFGPRDLVETPRPALVCTPRGMAGRWSGYRVIRSAARPEPSSPAAGMLSGRAEAAPLIAFMREMGVKADSFSDLRLLEQAYRLDIGEPTLDRRVGVMRLIEELSVDADPGRGGRDVLVQRLRGALATASAEDVLRLRNLRLLSFPAPNRIWKALEGWVAEKIGAPGHDAEMLSVLRDATRNGGAVEEWRTAVLDGFAVAAGSPRSSFPNAFWRWLQIHPEIVASIFGHVPAEAAVEERLASAAPDLLDEAPAEAVRALALSRGWLRLHGAALSASCTTLDAVRRHVAVDTDPAFLEGVRWALRRATPAELVGSALHIPDPRLPRLAGEAVAEDPSLLAGLDFAAIRVQAIWREALTIDPESWRGLADPVAAFGSILDSILDGREADRALLERLSDSPLADLGTYPRRPEIWPRIGGVARQNVLAATAGGWLRQASRAGVPFVPECDLETAILKGGGLAQTLDSLMRRRLGTAVRVVGALGRYDQQQFLRLLKEAVARTTTLTVSDAEGIGGLVLERRWGDVAAHLVRQYRAGRRDVKPALRVCYDMVNIWDRLVLHLVPVSRREKWGGLEELAVELYPGGPDDLQLWERAGGDDADLSRGEDGRTRWRRALQNIRNGRGPTAAALLAAMSEDFPNNERIPHLAEDGMFGGVVADRLGDGRRVGVDDVL